MDNTATLMQGQSSLSLQESLSTKKDRIQHDIDCGFVGIDKVKMQLRIIKKYFTYHTGKGNQNQVDKKLQRKLIIFTHLATKVPHELSGLLCVFYHL
jgi:hypothetical protein